jgi:tryptophan-rich sensory protein
MPATFDRRAVLGLLAWFVLVFAAAWLGSRATMPEIQGWYPTIKKQSFNPPDWIFGPVWTTLYALMAISAWLVWRPEGFRGARLPLAVFLVQLALNSLWSILFFKQHNIGAAFVEIVLLWGAIVLMIVLFLRRHRLAGLLQIPYLCWVSFAAVLNFEIWRLNG